MHLLLTGATGTIGRRLVISRLEHGDQVTLVSRDGPRASRLFAADANPNVRVVEGDCAVPGPWQDAIGEVDAVVHLAGAGIADRRWSASYRRTLVDSRLDSTHQVQMAFESARRRPKVLISASATGYYGDAGTRELDETAPAGSDFLADLCARWEAEARGAERLGVRVVLLRTGMVLDDRGGALPKIVPLFRRLVGGPLGSGRQYMPWIHWQDAMGIIDLALCDDRVRGPINMVAPNPITNREFAQVLGSVLERPSLLPVPKFALRIVAGGIAEALVSSQRAVPARATALGYRFAHPEIGGALRAALLPPVRVAATGAGPGGAATDNGMVSRGGAGVIRVSEPPARVRLLALDVDGTLLRSDGRLADPVVAALHRAERDGVAVVLATARSPRLMREIVAALRLQSPTINFNGAVIWNPIDHRSQFHDPLPADIARAVVAAARRQDPEVIIEIDTLDHCHTDRIDARLQLLVERYVQPDSVGALEMVFTKPITRINLVAPPERLARIIEPLQRDFWSQKKIAIFPAHPCLLQVTAPLVDKGIALQRIARKLGASRDEVMAIGDASNDLGMIEWAGFGVAMGNASAAVKNLADAVAPTNDENGVAWAVERWAVRKGT